MITTRDISREDFTITYRGQSLRVRIVEVRLWETPRKQDECDRFNIQVKLENTAAELLVPEDYLDTGEWTCIAHSDHNPNGGHDIRDSEDPKQTHVDVAPHEHERGYAGVTEMIFDGDPPSSNEAVIDHVTGHIRENIHSILTTFFTDGGRRPVKK